MAELKTQKNDHSVSNFLNAVEHPGRRADGFKLLEIFTEISGEIPSMWGDSIVGFGSYQYQYGSGRTGTWPLTGFSPRKQHLALYIMPGTQLVHDELQHLGKFKTGRSCLYINKLDDVNLPVLRRIIASGLNEMRKKYKT